jgi:putative oxidoreductase
MELGLFIIHVVVGALVAAHGTQKLFGWFGGHGPARTAASMESLGLRPGSRMAAGAGTAELVGGLMLAFGFLTPVAAVLVTAVMLVAARTAHAGKGPWISNGGWEHVLVIAVVAVGLAFNGAGSWSVDAGIGWDVSGFWWGLAAAVVALVGATGALAAGRRATSSSRDDARRGHQVHGSHAAGG